MPTSHRSLNMERSSREDLTGNRTLRAMNDLGISDQWQALDATTQLRIINFLADLGSPERISNRRFKADAKTRRLTETLSCKIKTRGQRFTF